MSESPDTVPPAEPAPAAACDYMHTYQLPSQDALVNVLQMQHAGLLTVDEARAYLRLPPLPAEAPPPAPVTYTWQSS